MKEIFNVPHPGAILKELYLDPQNLTITKAALLIGVNRTTLWRLVKGKINLSYNMTSRLSKAFPDTTPQYWRNLQKQYRASQSVSKYRQIVIV